MPSLLLPAVRPHLSITADDVALLDLLTSPTLPNHHSEPLSPKERYRRRDAALDPLLMAAAAASGPHVTRHHYHHDFFPEGLDSQTEGVWDWSMWTGEDVGNKATKPERPAYVSKQAPRRERLKVLNKENDQPTPLGRRQSKSTTAAQPTSSTAASGLTTRAPDARAGVSASQPPLQKTPDLRVQCMARTRIPTPHGPAFIHLYHNNWDAKEHLAIVIDPAQLSIDVSPMTAMPIRSRSLDTVWSESETDMDRITRGAYVGRLTPTTHVASSSSPTPSNFTNDTIPSPLIRIHSECFTGETIGSMRCDCGEQLDEALRLIAQPITIPSTLSPSHSTTIPGRGAVIYLRQEGRGIGLLSKLRAYNLQDLGHDTVTANIMLGHKADERGYEIAGAILRDLGIGGAGEGVRLLTNNPEKVHALEREGVRVVERVPMVPRSWQSESDGVDYTVQGFNASLEDKTATKRTAGATMIGGGAAEGEELEKYLRTKVLRMGHMLHLPSN